MTSQLPAQVSFYQQNLTCSVHVKIAKKNKTKKKHLSRIPSLNCGSHLGEFPHTSCGICPATSNKNGPLLAQFETSCYAKHGCPISALVLTRAQMYHRGLTRITWKKSAMVATWLAQAHFLASGTSSPTWQRERRRKVRKAN